MPFPGAEQDIRHVKEGKYDDIKKKQESELPPKQHGTYQSVQEQLLIQQRIFQTIKPGNTRLKKDEKNPKESNEEDHRCLGLID